MTDKPTGPPVQMRQAQAHLRTLKAEATAAEAEAKSLWELHAVARAEATEKRRQADALTDLIRDFPQLFEKAS